MYLWYIYFFASACLRQNVCTQKVWHLLYSSSFFQAAETGSGKTGVSTWHLLSFKELLYLRSLHQQHQSELRNKVCNHCHPQAFTIPVIQIVYETLKDEQEGKRGRSSIKTGGASETT